MTMTAPTRLAFNKPISVFEDPDIAFDDLQEQLMVTNVDTREVRWVYGRREYVLKPGAKPQPIKLEVIIKYLGDPRSAPGVQNTYRIPGEQRPGMVPDRYKEIKRLSVMYGIYEGMMNRMPEIRFCDIPRDRMDPNRDLFPEQKDKNALIVPRIKVQTLSGHEVKFPVYYPGANPYRYESDADSGEMLDVATELQRLRHQNEVNNERMGALEALVAAGEGDVPPATEDTVSPLAQ